MEIPRHWRLRKQRYSMVGGVCPQCDAKLFPMRNVCPHCGHGANELIAATMQAQPVVIPEQVLRQNVLSR